MLGHPIVISENFGAIDSVHTRYKGFIHCVVLPPDVLYLPVLWIRCRNRLIFALCTICAEEANQSSCEHTDEQRALQGVYTTPELCKAIQLGYKVMCFMVTCVHAYHTLFLCHPFFMFFLFVFCFCVYRFSMSMRCGTGLNGRQDSSKITWTGSIRKKRRVLDGRRLARLSRKNKST